MVNLERVTHRQLDETLVRAVLPEGLEVVVMPKPGYQSSHAGFFVQYGSVHNRYRAEGRLWEMPAGIAHFLEHKIFESAKDNIFELFASREAAVNAYTNFVSTCYYFTGTDAFHANLGTLLNFVQTPHITPENVEKEKGIITQEIRMYEDNPDWQVYFNLLKGMYGCHPVRTDIAGTVESIGEITAEVLLQAYRHWYTPGRMKVFVVGDQEPERVVETIRQGLLPEYLARSGGAEPETVEEPSAVARVCTEARFPTPVPSFFIGLKDDRPGLRTDALAQGAAASVLMDILFGKSGALYQRLMEQGLITGAFGMDYTIETDYAHGVLGSESADPDRAWETVGRFLDTEAASWVTDEEVERVKRKTIGRFLQACNSIDGLARTSVTLMNRGVDLFRYFDALQGLTTRDVRDRLEVLAHRDRRAVSIIRGDER